MALATRYQLRSAMPVHRRCVLDAASRLDALRVQLAACKHPQDAYKRLWRDQLDISDTQVDTEISMTDKPDRHIGAIDLTFIMPRKFSEADRVKLERASGMCPIKHSFRPDTQILVHFNYPE